jgi:hypothetical protein
LEYSIPGLPGLHRVSRKELLSYRGRVSDFAAQAQGAILASNWPAVKFILT